MVHLLLDALLYVVVPLWLLAGFTDYVLHNGPYAILYKPAALFGVRNTVQGFEWNPMGFSDFWKILKIA